MITMRATIFAVCSTLLILQCLDIALAASSQVRHAEESLGKTTTEASSQRRRPSTKSGRNYRLTAINSQFFRRPRKKQSDPERLLELLGHFFDPERMSIEEPKKDNDVIYFTPTDGGQYEEMVQTMNDLNMTQELEALSPDGESFSEDSGTLLLLKKWMLKKASCPIRYAWEDVGALFWPRWIKRGECASKRGTCSWPPGMHCVPSGSSTLNILRWQCRLPKRKGRRKRPLKTESRKDWRKFSENDQLNLKCQWIRVPYPVIKECMCTC